MTLRYSIETLPSTDDSNKATTACLRKLYGNGYQDGLRLAKEQQHFQDRYEQEARNDSTWHAR